MNNYQKILTGIVLVLIVFNLILLAIVWKQRPARKHFHTEHFKHNDMSGFIKNEIGFDSIQFKTFKKMQKLHANRNRDFHRKMRDLNHDLHQSIVQDEKLIESKIDIQIDSMHTLMKIENTEYIRSLSNLCNEVQKERLLQVLNQLPDRHGHRVDSSEREE